MEIVNIWGLNGNNRSPFQKITNFLFCNVCFSEANNFHKKKDYFKVISMKTLILIITWKESRKINNRSASSHILFIFQLFPTNIQVLFDARTSLLQVPYWCKYCIDASTIYWSKYMTDVSTVLMYVLHWCKFSIDVSSVLI